MHSGIVPEFVTTGLHYPSFEVGEWGVAGRNESFLFCLIPTNFDQIKLFHRFFGLGDFLLDPLCDLATFGQLSDLRIYPLLERFLAT